MEEETGWVKIHRKLLNNALSKSPMWGWFWVCLLLQASHNGSSFVWNKKKVVLSPGQFLTGRKKLANLAGISEGLVEKILNYLEMEQQIGQQKTTKYRIITILNWHKYQNRDSRSNNSVTTTRQQRDTYKNDKNDKNVKNTIPAIAVDREKIPKEDKKNPNSPLVVDLFREITPAYRLYFARPPQRAAAQRLFDAHGLEKLKGVIGFIRANLGEQYLPSIKSPCELEEKWSNLEAYAKRLSNKNKTNQVVW